MVPHPDYMRAFNLRGTNGSGKTYVARVLLAETHAKVAQTTKLTSKSRAKALVYEGRYKGHPIYFLGSYETTCGGCDTVQPFSILPPLLDHAMSKKHVGLVFYEGLLISHMLGSMAEVAKKYNEHHLMGFLDTPLEVCIKRVEHRRIERGNKKLFDPSRSLIPDYQRVKAAHRNAVAAGFNVTVIEHARAVAHVKEWLNQLVQEQLP